MAISVSCGMAWGLNSLIPRLRNLPPTTRLVLTRLVPFAAVVSAGIANIAVMRAEEVTNGIQIFDDEGTILGKSKKAGVIAVAETAASRVLNAAPVMAIPPLILLRLQRQGWLANHPRLTLPVNLAIIFGVSMFALPLAVGVFPRRQRIGVEFLEPEFHHHLSRNGDKVQDVWFNRGI
jgi:sideroflexin-5